jgi:4-hydroxybenzoate polyprenyltransferase
MGEARAVPLCVDCDGTLIRTDLLHEGLLLLVKQAPLALLLLPFWLLRGKAHFKQQVAERVVFRWESLPYRQRVLELMQAARAEERPVLLATASPKTWAEGIAAHVGSVTEVIATEDGHNLRGPVKAARLTARYGARGFDYAGNDGHDVAVWSDARLAIVVSSSPSLVARARAVADVQEVVPDERAGLLAYVKMIRVHQWLKNLLVFLPMVAAHRVGSTDSLLQATLAFAAFCLCASAVYVINDLLDLDADRRHVRKRNRPLAAGRIPVAHAIVAAPLLLAGSLALALFLPPSLLLVLGCYFAMTMAYSLRLKRQVIVDVLLLAALYTMRLLAGAMATSVVPSFWLLAFSMFLFLSLALVKRYSELKVTLAQSEHAAAGRGYRVADLPVLMALGVSAGMASVLVLALYINDPETRRLYPGTGWLWLVPTLMLYWVSRVWMKTHRDEIDDDPVVWAVRDWQSLLTVVLLGACFVAASTR